VQHYDLEARLCIYTACVVLDFVVTLCFRSASFEGHHQEAAPRFREGIRFPTRLIVLSPRRVIIALDNACYVKAVHIGK